MRTIISGPATRDTLDSAEILAGIIPTTAVTNGGKPDLGLPVVTYPICPHLGSLGEAARDYTLVQQADALVLVGENEHLVQVATQYGLPIHQEP